MEHFFAFFDDQDINEATETYKSELESQSMICCGRLSTESLLVLKLASAVK